MGRGGFHVSALYGQNRRRIKRRSWMTGDIAWGEEGAAT